MKHLLASVLSGCLVFAALQARTNGIAATQSIFKTPEQAAQTLYQAWRKQNRARALYVSNAEAVDKLFSVRRRAMAFKGCHKREEKDYECIYEDKENDIRLALLTEVGRRGYLIRSLSFSAEAE